MTDADFLLSVLADGQWHTLTEILARSFAERGCGLTTHSRAADLRAAGHVVEQRAIRNGSRRGSEYRLVSLAPSEPVPSPHSPAGSDAANEHEPPQLALLDTPAAPRGAYSESYA